MTAIGSTLYWLFVTVVAAVMFPIAVVVWAVTAPLDRRRRVLHRFTTLWAALYTWANPLWRVEVRGREHLHDDRVYVMVANHLSLVDIFVLYRIWAHFKWVSKIENFRLPFIGWNMRLNGYVPLRRGDRESVVAMLAQCRTLLREGSSIMMFPEGTRSKTGELKPFKPGAFELACEAGVPVLPIAVAGTFEALPKHGFAIGPARLRVTVLPAIESAELSPAALSERAHAAIAAANTAQA
ncbi:MAG: 1-acyl-sn-glycerol-3-phosphate acyltransferase [Nannocystaceae bacterium]|nr:1-acyl-sn-glycerol-3-phosphate acyltransferase [Nannocystaceae bacterium]